MPNKQSIILEHEQHQEIAKLLNQAQDNLAAARKLLHEYDPLNGRIRNNNHRLSVQIWRVQKALQEKVIGVLICSWYDTIDRENDYTKKSPHQSAMYIK